MSTISTLELMTETTTSRGSTLLKSFNEISVVERLTLSYVHNKPVRRVGRKSNIRSSGFSLTVCRLSMVATTSPCFSFLINSVTVTWVSFW